MGSKKGCKWTETTCQIADMNSNPEIHKWMKNNGCHCSKKEGKMEKGKKKRNKC